jgi:hypothetical protein
VTIPNPVALSCNLFQFNAPFLNPSCNPVNYSYIWDFGDGTQSNIQNPTHQFPIGSWNVTLTINTGCVPIIGNLNVNVVNGVLTGPIYKE